MESILLIRIIIAALFSFGFYEAIQEGRILSTYNLLLMRKGESRFYLSAALGGCSVCMGSFFGTALAVFFWWDSVLIEYTIIYLLAMPVLITVLEIILKISVSDKTVATHGLEVQRINNRAETLAKFVYLASLFVFVINVFPSDYMSVFVYLFSVTGLLAVLSVISAACLNVERIAESSEIISSENYNNNEDN